MNKLTKAEEEVMQYLWKHGANTVSVLIDMMDEPKPPHSTISSIIRILEKKGFVNHKAYGRTYEYFPVIAMKEYSKFSIKNLVSNYFGGSMDQLVSFLIKEEDLSLSDIANTLKNEDSKSTTKQP